MKKLIIAITAMIALACTGNRETKAAEGSDGGDAKKDVYVLGYAQDSTRTNKSEEFSEGQPFDVVYWKNGIATNIVEETGIPDGYNDFHTKDMIAIDGKLAFLGIARHEQDYDFDFFVWKDGKFTKLEGGSGVNNPMMVDIGGEIAVLGCIQKDDNEGAIVLSPVMWDKNGKHKTLDMGEYYNCDLHNVCVSDGDVYACGRVYNGDNNKGIGAIWKNGRLTTYGAPEGRTTMFGFTAICVSGNDVYAAMPYNSDKPNAQDLALWKNGRIIETLVKGGELPIAYCMAISGNDVYVGGCENIYTDNSNIYTKSLPRIWKNGKAMTIDEGEGLGYVSYMTVDENTVYACGNLDFYGVLWTNGKHKKLPGANGQAATQKVVVLPAKR
ncbi:MAG: hypothetical protein SOZ80_07855 [Prevotella sp.]|uniref:hypothetical protein n=1 Tax=Prevotella sp. TaxID=59823 RepID=UPI002A2C0F53|nr:hypothetical protein [Prevotella sp.]MDD7317756.1 hypothetical protein [Prevotellaceae bacterium]MDY4020671.1 hypothetical protein [Prevotella sp.]